MPRNYTVQEKIDREFSFLVHDDKNKAHYEQIINTPHTDIHKEIGVVLPSSYQVIKTDSDDGFVIALLDHASKTIAYYVKAYVWEDIALDIKPVTQVMLWRTNDVTHESVTSGFARKVFFNYLLEHFNVVASDSHQTMEGREFWIRQTGYALAIGLHVYRYDRMTAQLQKITDHATIRDNSCDLWGDEEHYSNILVIISKHELNAS